MAEIRFQLLGNSDGTPSVDTLSGSGMAFFGSTAGSSVQIGAYQDTSYVSNGDGTVYTDASSNVKFQTQPTYPSGAAVVDAVAGTPLNMGATGIRSMYGTLGIACGKRRAVKLLGRLVLYVFW